MEVSLSDFSADPNIVFSEEAKLALSLARSDTLPDILTEENHRIVGAIEGKLFRTVLEIFPEMTDMIGDCMDKIQYVVHPMDYWYQLEKLALTCLQVVEQATLSLIEGNKKKKVQGAVVGALVGIGGILSGGIAGAAGAAFEALFSAMGKLAGKVAERIEPEQYCHQMLQLTRILNYICEARQQRKYCPFMGTTNSKIGLWAAVWMGKSLPEPKLFKIYVDSFSAAVGMCQDLIQKGYLTNDLKLTPQAIKEELPGTEFDTEVLNEKWVNQKQLVTPACKWRE